jgi:hypothetical protein
MQKLEQVTREVVSRPKNVIDIKNLLSEASLEDIRESERLLQLVQERGYNRGKDLLAEFEIFRKPGQ